MTFKPLATFFTLGAVLAGTGCVVGPNYKGPPALSTPQAFQRADSTSLTAAPPATWWTALHDAELDQLIETAVVGSPSVEIAQARLREARASLRGAQLKSLPNTGASGVYVRTRNLTSLLGGGGAGSGSTNLYALGFDATWELDLFGANARALEGAKAAAEASQARLADLYVSLTAEVAQAYLALRDAQQRLTLTERDVGIDSQLLDLMRVRQAGGTASELDVERIAAQLDTTRANLTPLKAAILQQFDRLAVLTGRAPGAVDQQLSSPAPTPSPPEKVNIGDPAALLRHRPDILAAERTLAQQSAAIGQNVAALFPKVTLLGEVGFASQSPGALLNSNDFSYALAPLLQWTPWDFGRTRARIRQSEAARDEAAANYRQTVLSALEDAEDSLAQYGQQRDSVTALARARDSAERVYTLTQVRLRGGTAATIDLLDADTRRIDAELNYQRALAQLTQDYVALQKSLGLGWVAPDAS